MSFDAPLSGCSLSLRMLRSIALPPLALLALASPAGAWAAQARVDALAALPGQVVGVSGSGDQLSLRLKSGNQERVLKIGDIYADGWILIRLSPTLATLTRLGAIRQVGLNPTGALPQAAISEAPSQVQTIGGLLGAGGGAGVEDVSADAGERAETVASLDQRIAALEYSTDPDANETIGYLRIARAALIVGAQE